MRKKAISLLLALGMMACMMPVEAMAETDVDTSVVTTADDADSVDQEPKATSQEREETSNEPQENVESDKENSSLSQNPSNDSDAGMATEQSPASGLSNLEERYVSGPFTYVVNPDGTSCTIVSCDKTVTGTIVIPEKVDEFSVTSIGYSAFSDCAELEGVEIPDGVTKIGAAAFDNCIALQKIIIPSSVVNMGDGASIGLTMCEKIQSAGPIGSGADCEFGWTDEIPYGAFREWIHLKTITIPDGVTKIGESAFYGCKGLSKLIIPGSVTTIGERDAILTTAFFECENLSTAGPIGSGANYEFGWTEKIPEEAFGGCTQLTSVTIPEGITTIGTNALENCGSLEKLVIPASVEKVSGFRGCDRLVTAGPIGSGADYEFGWTQGIPDNAFLSCEGLTTITIPEGITSIGQSAFAGCSSLTNLIIPESVQAFEDGGNPFSECSNLLSAGPIGSGANYQFGWTEEIADRAFAGCEAMESITIPDGVSKIGVEAFKNCKNLCHLIIPGSVNNMGSKADSNKELFAGCESLLSAGPIGSNANYQFGWTKEIPTNAFSGCKFTVSIVIPDGITTIGNNAFRNCRNLSKLRMPESVTVIGEEDPMWPVFDACDGLVTAGPIGSGANYEFGWTKEIPVNAFYMAPQLQSVELPEGIKSIGKNAFYGCKSLNQVKIPEGVTTIGDAAFLDCTNLKKMIIPESVTELGDFWIIGCDHLVSAGPIGSDSAIEFGWEEAIPKNAFAYGSGIVNVVIPEGIISIGNYAFSDCNKLQKVIIPNSVNSMGLGAFDGCDKLTTAGPIGSGCSIEYGWSASIPSHAFTYALKSIVIPKEIHYIGWNAFGSSVGLEDVYYGGNETDKNTISGLSQYEYNEPLIKATWHYNSTGPDDLETPLETSMRIRFLTQWDAENQIAYFADDTLHLGAAVTEETDMAFLANVDDMVANYVLVKTKDRDDGMVGPNVLLSMQPIEIESRFAKVDEIAADSVTLSTGDKLPFGWEFSVDGSEFPEYQNKFVICSSYENQVFAINAVELAVGTVNGYDKTAGTITIGDTVYQISSLADKTVDALLESAPEGQKIYYYADADRMLYRALLCDGAVSEEANFNVDIYRANQLLDPERYVYAASVGQDIARKTPSGTYAEVMSGNGKFTAAVQTWDSSTTAVDILQNGATEAGKFLVEKKDIYTALILASLQDISEKSAGEEIIENGEKINSALKKVASGVKDKLKLDLYVAEEYQAMTTSEKSEVSSQIVKELKNTPGLENSIQTAESIGKVLGTTSDVMDLYHSLLNNTYLVTMAESQKQLVAALYENCPASKVSLKAALFQCKTITEASYEDVIEGTLTSFFASQGFSAAADEYWNLVTETAEEACPLLKAMSVGYKAGKTASNLLFNTDSVVEQYYKVVAVTDLEEIVAVTLNQLEQQYRQSKSAADAQTYLAMCDLLYGIFSVDCSQAIDLLDEMDSAALTQWAKLLAGILGNEDSPATSYEETQKVIQRLQDQYDLNHEHILTVWVEYLPEDYPDTSLYEYYTEITGKDPLAMQKRLLVACPVNVRILDENGQVVASVVDGRLSASGNVAVRLDGEDKSFYFYDAADYTVEIQGYDAGSMNVTATEYNAQQEEIRSVYYNNVAVTAQSNYQMNVQGAKQQASNFLLTDEQGTPIANTLDTNHVDEAEMHAVRIENGVLQVGGVFATQIRAYPGQQVYVYASGLSDQQLLRWETSENAILEDETALVTCFVMPDEDVSLKAILTQTGLDPDPGDSDYEIPSGLTAVYGQSLAEVILPEHWAWSAPDEKVGDVGAHEFEAIYTPNSAHAGNPVTEMLTVTVSPKDIAGADVQLGVLLTYNGQQQIQSVKAVYKDGQAVTCEVIGNTGRDAGNYTMTLSGKGNYTGTVQVPWRIAAADYQFTISSQKMVLGSGLLDIQYEKIAAGVAQESVEGTLTWYLDDKYEHKAANDYRFTGQDPVTLYWIFEPVDGQDNYKKDPKRGKTTFELIQKEAEQPEQGKNDTGSESSAENHAAMNTVKAEPVQDVPEKTEENKITQAVVPQTGDPYPLGLWTGLLVASGIAAGCVFLFGRKRSTRK